MSATNYTSIQLYRTTTAAATPSAGNLAAGELAINTTDEKLYFKNAGGTVKLLASSAGASGTVTSVDVSGGTTGLTYSGGPITSSGTITMAGTLGVANGGTGATTFTANGILYGNTTSAVSVTAAGTTGQVLIGNTGAAPSWAALSSNAVTSLSFGTTGLTPATATQGAITVAGTLVAANGGTGQSSYAVGDILYASTTTALSKLADVDTGNALISGGVGVAPLYGKIGLTTHVSGTLAVGNGGTGATTLTGVVIGNGTSAFSTVTAPSGAIVGTTDTQTLTNKTITPRVNAQTTTTSPWAWNSDSYDQQSFSALANALTINADAGTPVDGEKQILRFEDNATPRILTFTGGVSKGFRDLTGQLTVSGSNFTYTTVASKLVYFGCIYNTADSRWDIVAVTQEP